MHKWDRELVKEVAEKAGISTQAAGRRLYQTNSMNAYRPKYQHETGRGPRETTKQRSAKVAEAIEAGYTLREIAKHLGLCKSRVGQLYKIATGKTIPERRAEPSCYPVE